MKKLFIVLVAVVLSCGCVMSQDLHTEIREMPNLREMGCVKVVMKSFKLNIETDKSRYYTGYIWKKKVEFCSGEDCTTFQHVKGKWYISEKGDLFEIYKVGDFWVFPKTDIIQFLLPINEL